MMGKGPGTYALILEAGTGFKITVGKLGPLAGKPGYYVYVGSAFGPGGVNARLKHHRQIARKPHWHIDYLGLELSFNEVWYTHDDQKRECEWVSVLTGMKGALTPFPGFGASDCTCPTHLVFFKSRPSFQGFRKRLYSSKVAHAAIKQVTSPYLTEL